MRALRFTWAAACAWTVLLLANACAEVASNEADDGVARIVAVEAEGATAAECSALLTTRPDGEAPCNEGVGCDALAQRPGDTYRWTLVFRDATTRSCAAAYLRSKGVSMDSSGEGIVQVLVVQRADVAEILALRGLDFYSISCADPETCCADLSTCVTNPLCRPIVAMPTSLEGACLGAEKIIGCSASPFITGDSAIWGIDPSGGCWLVREFEVPAGWKGYGHESLLIDGPPEVRALCPVPPADGGVIQAWPTVPPCEP